jgi:hypothetical protein
MLKQLQVFSMEISLNVLEHLGINLYSNVPAVLSEAVANAWDADAEEVRVSFDGETITIQDDGEGMNLHDINARFLRVGYRRRDLRPPLTEKFGRRPMGRKGIGKLSLFSIADTVEVHTTKDGETNAFIMKLSGMRTAIDNNSGSYKPKPIEPEPINGGHGTRITLRDLRKRQTIRTPLALRRRLARRFSIIGPKNNFVVYVNEKLVEPSDRGYYNKIQCLWTYGNQDEVIDLCKSELHENRTDNVKNEDLSISGWLGTVKQSSDLKDEEGDNLNRIAIFMRGKLAQEDLLDDFTERGVYATYLIGEIHVDGLDDDDKPDAATSSRQKLVEGDERYIKLREIIQKELKYIQNRWSAFRTETGAKKAVEIPAIKEWMDALPKDTKPKAQKWIGQLNKVQIDDEKEQKRLYKHAVLAFEFYRYNENVDKLEEVKDEAYEEVVKLFSELDAIENTLYSQIIKQRIAVIRALQEKVDQDLKERAIQEHIFDHLWLIDPAWERADAPAIMEKRVDKLFKEVDVKLPDEIKDGRVDIKYRKTAGTHVIIELKKPGKTISVFQLGEQIEKYRAGMELILDNLPERDKGPVEFICLLGKYPTQWKNPKGQQIVTQVLDPLGARIVLYDTLLSDAYAAYNAYLDKQVHIDKLSKIIGELEEGS